MQIFISRYGKKIWLTEFAKCCTHDKSEVIDFVKVRLDRLGRLVILQNTWQEIIPRLEAANYVYRYSWFITRFNEKNRTGDWYVDSINSLFEKDSSELSEVGRLYNSL